MAIDQISGYSAPPPVAALAAAPDKAAAAGLPAALQLQPDTVHLTAQAMSRFEGESPAEAAPAMKVDIKAVNAYRSMSAKYPKPAPTPTPTAAAKPVLPQLRRDTVYLSALAKTLKSVGESPAEIAQAMNVDIQTVYSYLGMATKAKTAAATSATEAPAAKHAEADKVAATGAA